MARLNITECDRCGVSPIDPAQIEVDIGPDPQYEGHHTFFDVCPKCAFAILKVLVGRMDLPTGRAFAKDLEAVRKSKGR